MKTRKNIRVTTIIIILLLIIMYVVIDKLVWEKQNKGRFMSNLTVPMGPSPEGKSILSAEEIEDLKTTSNRDIPMESIINGSRGYKDLHNSLFSLLKTVHEQGSLPYEDKGCYISITPIHFWDAGENKISTVAWFAVFSQNFDKVITLVCYEYGNTLMMQIDSEFYSTLMEYFCSQPNEKYICIFNGMHILILDSQNVLYDAYNKTTVDGDYYHVLDYEKLGVSYNEIISQDKLIWIEF